MLTFSARRAWLRPLVRQFNEAEVALPWLGGRRVVMLNSDDMASLSIAPHELVDLTSHFRGQARTARGFVAVPYDIPRGCACTYFPEANALVPAGHVAHTSNTPASKSVVITIARAADARHLDGGRTPEAQTST